MKYLPTLILALLLPGYSWAETAKEDGAYVQPYPHSSGAALLPYCEKTDEVVSQLRCDYYVQGVADLATIPQQGQPLACIPQGQNRTQLMQIAVNYLKTVNPDTLEKENAASLILQGFRATFPCPAKVTAEASKTGEPTPGSQEMAEASKKTGETAPISKETAEAIYKAMIEAKK